MKDLLVRMFPEFRGGAVGTALLLLRVVAGVAFVLHGWPKIQNPFGWMGPDAYIPGVLLALAAVAELAGGLGWIVGLLTPIASFGLLCTMGVAVAHHVGQGDPFVRPGGGSYELALVYLTISVLFLLVGPGKFSLDAIVFRRRRPMGYRL